jgi:hypothetical protein
MSKDINRLLAVETRPPLEGPLNQANPLLPIAGKGPAKAKETKETKKADKPVRPAARGGKAG